MKESWRCELELANSTMNASIQGAQAQRLTWSSSAAIAVACFLQLEVSVVVGCGSDDVQQQCTCNWTDANSSWLASLCAGSHHDWFLEAASHTECGHAVELEPLLVHRPRVFALLSPQLASNQT